MSKEFYLASTLNPTVQCFFVEGETEHHLDHFKKMANEVDFKYFDDLKLLSQFINKNFKISNESTINLVKFKTGVTDNRSIVLKSFLERLNEAKHEIFVQTAELFFNEKSFDFNSLVQEKKALNIIHLENNTRLFNNKKSYTNEDNIGVFDFINSDISVLLDLNKKSNWALTEGELKVIKEHYSSQSVQNQRKAAGLSLNPTDVEIEVFAQTWSEHCKHKIFNAKIDLIDQEGNIEKVDGLFKEFIKGSTEEINSEFAVSVFHDNAGVVDFDPNIYLAIKVETHNSPSALDPYGGAITGILGVNRDILGTGLGFLPIANTDVFCVGPYQSTGPKGMFSPKEILHGVHRGVMDGGNKSGIPTVAGAMLFDESYIGKPLVYCGTIGASPKDIDGLDQKNKYLEVSDLIVMAGGRVGADGIHGATMSSVLMDNDTPKSMVQIGDPFTQKKLTDFVMALKNKGLLKSLTDNGAGGLSSSVGEMSLSTNGAKIYLDRVPLKYSGLKPWEMMVSESQERMTLAIDPKCMAEVELIAKEFQCEIAVLGEFTKSGFLEIFYKDEMTGLIDLHFLEKGLPRLSLKAFDHFKTINKNTDISIEKKLLSINDRELVTKLLLDYDIASKEKFIRQYDHEVKAATIVKPLEGEKNQAGLNDGGVIWLYPHGGDYQNSISITMGVSPQWSLVNPNLMAKLAVDEAVRGAISLGANIEKLALTDNFCWPDPVDENPKSIKSKYLASLVHSCRGLSEICIAYKTPLISGKDSMKNDYKTESQLISIKPTLLMTAIAKIENLEHIRKAYVKEANDAVYLLAPKFYPDYFGHYYEKYSQVKSINDFQWNLSESKQFYKKIHKNLKIISSLHDVSDGGALISLIESLQVKQLGFEFAKKFTHAQIFSEYPSQFIVSIKNENKSLFENEFSNQFIYLGKADKSQEVKLSNGDVLFKMNSLNESMGELWN